MENNNSNGQETTIDYAAEIARLKAENAVLKTPKAKGIATKVSEKGCLSVYGLGRFPVTLYKGQWERLLSDETIAQVKAALLDPRLTVKETATAEVKSEATK